MGTQLRSVSTSRVAEAGLALALAALLKGISVFHLPAGGSITAACLAPLWAFAARHGFRQGVLLGACFGVLDFLLNPVWVHWKQALLDYPFAFMTVGLAGVRQLPMPLGCALSAVLRYGAHVLSGVLYFAATAPPGVPALAFSEAYNLYVFPDAVLAGAVLVVVSSRSPGILRPRTEGP